MQQRTAKDMIQFLPNYKYIAYRLHVSVQTVQNWVMWNYIGRESRVEFFELLKEFGFPNASYAEIVKLEKKLPKKEVQNEVQKKEKTSATNYNNW